MNATLEAMARALFQSWFVDFDPVRAKLDGRPRRPRPSHRRPLPRPFQDSERRSHPERLGSLNALDEDFALPGAAFELPDRTSPDARNPGSEADVREDDVSFRSRVPHDNGLPPHDIMLDDDGLAQDGNTRFPTLVRRRDGTEPAQPTAWRRDHKAHSRNSLYLHRMFREAYRRRLSQRTTGHSPATPFTAASNARLSSFPRRLLDSFRRHRAALSTNSAPTAANPAPSPPCATRCCRSC